MVYQIVYEKAVSKLERLNTEKEKSFKQALSTSDIARFGSIEEDITQTKIIKNISKSKLGGAVLHRFLDAGGRIEFTNMESPAPKGEKQEKPTAYLDKAMDNGTPIIVMDPTDTTPAEKTQQVLSCLKEFETGTPDNFIETVQKNITEHDFYKSMLNNKASLEERHYLDVEDGYKKLEPINSSHFEAPKPN